jgi:hypothetical protein
MSICTYTVCYGAAVRALFEGKEMVTVHLYKSQVATEPFFFLSFFVNVPFNAPYPPF